MSSSITFQNNKPYDPITLSIWDDKYAIQAPIVLEDATLVKDCLFIYKAKMKFVNDAAGQAAPETTIVKFSSGDPYQMMKMEKEANFYVDHLRTTYGNGVPTFYGLYKGNYSRKDRRGNLHTGKCACLVLQYCGEPLRIAMFKELENDRPFRCVVRIVSHCYAVYVAYGGYKGKKLVELFERLHIQLGIWHRDLYPFDVLNNDGVPFIIDFSNASLHKCEISVAIVEGEVEPSPRLIPCPEFSAFLDALDTWWLPTVTVWHRGLYVTNNRVKSAAYIFERIRLDRYLREDGLTDEDFWNEAVVAWKTIRSHWAKYHPKDSTIPPLGITDYEEYLAKKDGRNDALAKAG